MKHLLQGKNIKITSAIEDYILQKVKFLERFVNRFNQDAVEIRIESGKPSRHHHSGFVFYAEVNLKLPGRLLRAEASHLDPSLAINKVFKEIERQVKKYKDSKLDKKLRNKNFKKIPYEHF